MTVAHRPRQPIGDVVSIAGWEPDEDFPYGPQGAKPKRIVICPSPSPHPFLIGGHRYLFKEPTGNRAQQIWSEVIAYEVAREAGPLVPPAFLAFDPVTGVPGALVEFFYGYPFEEPLRFVHAIERFQGLRIGVDERRGSLLDNVRLCRYQGIIGWRTWWAQTLAFDALIGNTDRHSENWGFLIASAAGGELTYSMAPAFDNGTSLGFSVRDGDLARFSAPDALARFVARGLHHFGWLPGVATDAQHAELCGRYARVYHGARREMEPIIGVNDLVIDELLDWCVRFDFAVPFLAARADFVGAQLRLRREQIARAIGA